MNPPITISISYPTSSDTLTTQTITLPNRPPPFETNPPNSTTPGQYTYSGLHDAGTLPLPRPDKDSLLATAVVVREVSNKVITEIVDREASEAKGGGGGGQKRKNGE